MGVSTWKWYSGVVWEGGRLTGQRPNYGRGQQHERSAQGCGGRVFEYNRLARRHSWSWHCCWIFSHNFHFLPHSYAYTEELLWHCACDCKTQIQILYVSKIFICLFLCSFFTPLELTIMRLYRKNKKYKSC